jgi:hypothetical protein
MPQKKKKQEQNTKEKVRKNVRWECNSFLDSSTLHLLLVNGSTCLSDDGVTKLANGRNRGTSHHLQKPTKQEISQYKTTTN